MWVLLKVLFSSRGFGREEVDREEAYRDKKHRDQRDRSVERVRDLFVGIIYFSIMSLKGKWFKICFIILFQKKMSLSKHEKLYKDDKENDSRSCTTFECNGL